MFQFSDYTKQMAENLKYSIQLSFLEVNTLEQQKEKQIQGLWNSL